MRLALTPKLSRKLTELVRNTLLALVLAAGIFWIWLAAAGGISEKIGAAGAALHSLLPGGLMIFLALIAFRWPVAGGIQLTAAGIFFRYYFNVCDWFVFWSLIAPLTIAGLWALLSGLPPREKRNPEVR